MLMPPSGQVLASLSFRVTAVLVLLVVLVMVPGFVAEESLYTVRQESLRAGQASNALREYLVLQALGNRIEDQRHAGLLRTPQAQASAMSAIENQIAKIDRATAIELRIIRDTTLPMTQRSELIEEEQHQGRATARIRQSMRTYVGGGTDDGWRDAVLAGIAGEQAEVRAAQVRAVTALERTQVAFFVTGLVLALAGIGTLFWLRGNVLDPLRRLLASTQRVAQRDFSTMLPERGPPEFRFLNRSFNAMALEIGSAQARLEAANQQLEGQVRARTGELLEANTALRQMDDKRRRFVAEAGHELRTPIAVLRSDAEVALRDRQATAQSLRASLERIVRTAGVLGRLVDDMLRIARADAPVLFYERERIDLVALVRNTLDEFRPMIEADGGTASLSAGPPLAARVDPVRIGQVLRIVFDNAVKHSSAEPCIWAEVRESEGHAVIRIADRGEGIAPELLPALFERERRPRRRSAEGGLGLGLTIAATIVEAHGGTIAVQSVVGQGTVVEICLPCETAHSSEAG